MSTKPDSIVIQNIDRLTDQQALEQFCKQLEACRGQENQDEALTRSLPKAVVAWLYRVTPRLKTREVDFASITFHVMHEGYEDDGTPYLQLKVSEECTVDDIMGPVPGAVS